MGGRNIVGRASEEKVDSSNGLNPLPPANVGIWVFCDMAGPWALQ